MMRRLFRTNIVVVLSLGCFGSLTPTARGQSLTTLFNGANNNDGNAFNLQVLSSSGITIQSFGLNINTAGGGINAAWGAGQTVQAAFYYIPNGTYVGNLSGSVTGWTFIATASATVLAEGSATTFSLPSALALPTGTHAFVIGMVDSVNSATGTLAMTNGTGTRDTPGSGNQTFSNADLRLLAGAGFGNFSGTPGSGTESFGTFSANNAPRIWNGTINYTVNTSSPEPGTLALLTLGLLTGVRLTRRK